MCNNKEWAKKPTLILFKKEKKTMKIYSENLKVVKTENRKGTKDGKEYDFTILYANLENGIQEQIGIPNELAEKCKKDKIIKIEYEVGYNKKIYAKEVVGV